MRPQSSVSTLVVAMVALISGCSSDEPRPIAAEAQPSATEPVQRAVQLQAEEDCRQLVEVEARLELMRRRYTERHPEVQAARSEIVRLRSALPADGTFCNEQIDEQRLRDAGQPGRN